jgi:hypothetical protein
MLKKIIYGRKSLSPKVQSILNKYGNEKIIYISIGRKPINELITKFIKVISTTPYDTLFHLFIILHTNKANILLEKNEVINMAINPHIEAEYINITIPQQITINKLLENTSQQMSDKFIKYSAYGNNCQDFIKNILLSNNIHQGLDFVKQSTEDIFKNNPTLRKFSNTITDIAGRFDIIKQGGKLSKSNGLYSDQIENILKTHHYKINGVFSKDKLPKQLKLGWYVINLQSENDGNGTHWVAFKYKNNEIDYFDSFGFPPPNEIMYKAKGKILYSNKEIQDYNSTCCGWFCIAAIISDNNTKSHFNNFLNMFSKNTNINDKLLFNYLKNKKIIT